MKKDLTEKEKTLSIKAIEYVRKNRKAIIKRFADKQKYLPAQNVVAFFMAGSPGVGKTEFSVRLLKEFESGVVRIDADEIRNILPGYEGHNSFIFQSACSLAVEKILDYVFSNKQNFILDGTFAHLETSRKNIIRSIKHNRRIVVYYLYLAPKTAWAFTQKRERLEGRKISRELFIDSFFLAQKSVESIKNEFGNKIELNIVVVDIDKESNERLEKLYINVDNIASYVKNSYNNKEDLVEALDD